MPQAARSSFYIIAFIENIISYFSEKFNRAATLNSIRFSLQQLFCFLLKNRLVLGAEPSSYRHGGKGDKVGHLGHLLEDDEGKKRADKGCHGVVSAGPRRTEDALCVHVKEDAQPVRHKSHAEHGKYTPKVGQSLSDA